MPLCQRKDYGESSVFACKMLSRLLLNDDGIFAKIMSAKNKYVLVRHSGGENQHINKCEMFLTLWLASRMLKMNSSDI